MTPLRDIFHRLCLKELEQSDAILGSQVYVFNPFFYERLNHRQAGYAYFYCGFSVKLIFHCSSPNLGYESVRKWTSRFDIFQKNYIIIPINEE